MRVWEVESAKYSSSALVREQDFIMRVRRMQRNNLRALVVNFILSVVEPLAKNAIVLEEVQKKMQEVARASNGLCYEMSNGDVFMVWESPDASSQTVVSALEKMLAGYGAISAQTSVTYRMPDNYAPLRERTNYYVELVQTNNLLGNGEDKVEDAQGRMTAKNAEQIENLLGEIDVRRYGRTQTIYRNAGYAWQAIGEEYYVSFEDLRRERFPKLEIIAAEHFFLALCSTLDQRLFKMLTTSYETISGRMINMNITVASVAGDIFAQFVHRVPHEHRSLIGFELNCGDLFQDFQQTLSAMETLKREGFRVVLDSMTPDMVGYLDVINFPVDTIKLNVSKDHAAMLELPKIQSGLARLPINKLIFYRCDNKNALATGQKLGVSVYQGWLIDDLAGKKKK